MVKILKIICILCVSFCLCFGAFANDISDFDANFDNSSKSTKLRYYHSMKNIYIKSIIKNNKNLKIDSLKRLVISSKALNLDYSEYEKELAGLGVTNFQTKKNIKEENKAQSKIQSRTISKKLQNQDIEHSSHNGTLRLLEVEKVDSNSIRLKFNRAPLSSEVKEFNLNNKKTNRFVMDFSGILIGKSRSIKNHISDEVRVAQFNNQTLRVVFSDSNKLEYSISRDDNYIIITSNKKSINDNATTNTNTAVVFPTKKHTSIQKADNINTNSPKVNNSKVKTKQIISVDNAKRSSKLIVLDAGHGGKDAGAVGNGYYEKNIVLQVALKTGKILKDMGYQVAYTRSSDKFINLRDRTKMANDKAASLFISIHANAAPNLSKAKSMSGIETFFLSPARSERSMNAAALENKSDIEEMNHFSKTAFLNFLNREKIILSNKLAIDIQANLLNSIKSKYQVADGGVREAPFWVLVGALMPAVLIEVGYISHPSESKKIASDDYQSALARGIAKGIEDYFIKTSM